MKYLGLFVCLSCCSFVAFAEDIDGEIPQRESSGGLFLSGALESFNKIGFTNKQLLPTNSYGYMLGELSLGYRINKFEFMLGGAAAGITFDSTRGDRLAFNYVGFYPGYALSRIATPDNTSNVFVHNASVLYSDSNFDIKAGRFNYSEDWVDSYIEGVVAHVKINEDLRLKFLALSTTALVGYGWFINYSTAYSTYGLFNAELGYKKGFFDSSIFLYFAPREHITPGFNISLNFGDEDSISYKTKINVILPYHFDSINKIGNHFFADFKDARGLTTSILARQDINFFNKYNLAIAVYKNIGNANARLGLFGNPIGIDVWDNSTFSFSSLNASVAPDAFSFLFFSSASYKNLALYVEGLDIGFDIRYTNAPSANEYSFKLYLNWQILDKLSFGLIANYYTHITFSSAWDSLGKGLDNKRHVFDRSYLMATLAYRF